MTGNPYEAFDTFAAVTFIVGIIYVIALVVFFIMAVNLAKIRKAMPDKLTAKYFTEIAEREAYVGNNQVAIENYLRAKFMLNKNEGFCRFTAIFYDQKKRDQAILEIDEKIAALKNK